MTYDLIYGIKITRPEDRQRIENPDQDFNMILNEYRPAFEYDQLATFFIKSDLGDVYIGRPIPQGLVAADHADSGHRRTGKGASISRS